MTTHVYDGMDYWSSGTASAKFIWNLTVRTHQLRAMSHLRISIDATRRELLRTTRTVLMQFTFTITVVRTKDLSVPNDAVLNLRAKVVDEGDDSLAA